MNLFRSPHLARRAARGQALLACGGLALALLAPATRGADAAPPAPAAASPAPASAPGPAPATENPGGAPVATEAVGLLVTNALAGSAAGLTPQMLMAMMTALDDRQKLGIGDKLLYRVIEDQDPVKSVVVSESGDVDVPYFGLVAAGAKTCKQLATEVKKTLEQQLYYRATVIIGLEQINKKRVLGKVYVVGQVRQTGPLDIPDDEVFTVSKAILKAGGFSDFADKKRVRISRGGRADGAAKMSFVVNVAEVWEKGKSENDLKLEPDDLIYVPARLVNL